VSTASADPSDCLLSYQFATAPSPLQVSTEAADSPGMINVWISAPGDQVIYCNKIIVAVPVGTAPGEFSTVTPALTPNTPRWVSSAVVVTSGADIGLDPRLTYAQFTVTCPADEYWKIDYELIFSVTTTAVNPHPDTFPFVVAEYSAVGSPDDLTQHRGTFTLQKVPAELYLTNLVAVSTATAESTQPRGEFRAGEPIRLVWQSNGDRFTVRAGKAAPADAGPNTSYTFAAGLDVSTTVSVQATRAGEPAQVLTASTTITISDPLATPRTETAGSLTTVGAATLSGEAQLASPRLKGGLTVTGESRLAAVTASALTVRGQATLPAVTAAGARVQGTASGGGSLNALATVTADTITTSSSLAGLVPRAVTAGRTYTASSDGYLIGVVWWPNSPTDQVATRISGNCSGVGTVYATGGNYCPWRSKTEAMMRGNAGSFTLSVPKGASFSAGVEQRFGTGAPTSFVWMPMARNATLQEIDPQAAGLNPVPEDLPVTMRRPSLRRPIERILAVVGDIFGDRLTPDQRRRVARALDTLAGQH
jgi:hypothetical protein